MFACDAQKGLVVNELPMPSQLVPKPDRKRESTLAEEVVLARWQQQQLLLCCCRISSENFFCNGSLFADKENRGNRFEGKRVLDARKPQEGPREPREPRNREDRNNRRNRPDDENATAPAPAAGFGHVR